MAEAIPGGGAAPARYGSGRPAPGPPRGRVRWGRAARATAVALLAWGAPPPSGAAAVPEALPEFVEVAVARGEDGFTAVAADPRDPRRLWAASGARVLVSRDGGHTWADLVRLPGSGASPRGAGGDGEAESGEDPPASELDGGLDDEAGDEADRHVGSPAVGEAAAPPVPEAGGARIHGLRAAGDELWIAASDGAYRLAPSSGGAELAWFATPGAAVLAVAPGPPGSGRAWLATSDGLFRIDGGQVARVAGEAGRIPATDVDVAAGGGGVAVAARDGLFVSRDGGLSFAGPVALGEVAGPVAAVRVAGDGSVLAVSPDGVAVRYREGGGAEARIVPGLGRQVRRLHLGGGVAWFVTGDGLFRWVLPGAWNPGGSGEGPGASPAESREGGVARPVHRGLPAAGIHDLAVVGDGPPPGLPARDRSGSPAFGGDGSGAEGPGRFPAGGPRGGREGAESRGLEGGSPGAARLLVAADRGLFLARSGGRPGESPSGAPHLRTPPGGAPPVAHLVRWAEEHLGLGPLPARSRRSRAALLPRVDASWTEVPRDGGYRDTWAVVARWDLSRLLDARDVALSAAERRLQRSRRSLTLRIERALRARARLLGAAPPPGSPWELALSILDVEEQTARLDGWTGGRFTARGAAGGDGGSR